MPNILLRVCIFLLALIWMVYLPTLISPPQQWDKVIDVPDTFVTVCDGEPTTLTGTAVCP